MPEPYRVAVYYAPERADPLWQLGCAWLGRDAETGSHLKQPSLPGIAEATSEPRRYGFHATLKPPMRLTSPFAFFIRDAERLAKTLPPCPLPPLRVAVLGRFLALIPAAPAPALHNLADTCVRLLDPDRAPEDATAQAKRLANCRTERQRANVLRWGYPYVLTDWQFHMTLSNPTEPETLALLARRHFANACTLPRRVESLSVFVEPAPGAPFELARRIVLS